nr:hypothetical protein [uncultured Marinifilum sp.]
MTKKEDIYKDEFIKELIKDAELEEPSLQFTNNVMDEVMQDWLAKPIKVKKNISGKQLFWVIVVVSILTLIILGTDVRTLISELDHPFFNQLDIVLLKPLHQMLNIVFINLKKLPLIIYIFVVAMASLATFDGIINKLLHKR